jgi:hypothetical protein
MRHGALLQTGFRLQGRKGILTALHGVADGKAFSAVNESGDVLNGLTIAGVDLDNDLALLRSTEIENRPADGLPSEGSAEVEPGESLRVLGHPQGINLYEKRVIAGTPVLKNLHELIPPASASAFDRRKSPSAGITVLNIQGSLVPGDSGAPVLNARGKMIGIVNGGLLGGAASISWAIPLQFVAWRDSASASTRLAELAVIPSRDLFAVNPDPSAGSAAREMSALDAVPATLADYAKKIAQLPVAASVYERDLKAIVDLIRESPEFEREHPRDSATAYRLYAASLLFGPVKQHPLKTLDLAYPWVREALRFQGAFRDQNDLREAGEFFRSLLVESPPDVLMADLLRREFRVAMLEASAVDVSKWVDQTMSFAMAIKKDPQLEIAVTDAVSGKRSEPAAGALSRQETAALRMGLTFGGNLFWTTIAGSAEAGKHQPQIGNLPASLAALGLSEAASQRTVTQLKTAMRNPNPMRASDLLLEQINSVRNILDKRGDIRLSSVVRIGFVIGYVADSSRFILDHFTPAGNQIDQLSAVYKKYTGTLAGDIRLARLPKAITQPLEEISTLLLKPRLDFKVLAERSSKFDRLIPQQQ